VTTKNVRSRELIKLSLQFCGIKYLIANANGHVNTRDRSMSVRLSVRPSVRASVHLQSVAWWESIEGRLYVACYLISSSHVRSRLSSLAATPGEAGRRLGYRPRAQLLRSRKLLLLGNDRRFLWLQCNVCCYRWEVRYGTDPRAVCVD